MPKVERPVCNMILYIDSPDFTGYAVGEIIDIETRPLSLIETTSLENTMYRTFIEVPSENISKLTFSSSGLKIKNTIKLDKKMMEEIAKYNKNVEIQNLEEIIKEKQKEISKLDDILEDKSKRVEKIKKYIAEIYDLDLKEDEDDYDDYDYYPY